MLNITVGLCIAAPLWLCPESPRSTGCDFLNTFLANLPILRFRAAGNVLHGWMDTVTVCEGKRKGKEGERHSLLILLSNSPRGRIPPTLIWSKLVQQFLWSYMILQYIRHYQLDKMTYQHYSGCTLTGIQAERSIYIFWKEGTCSRLVFKWFLVQEMNLLTSVISRVTFVFAVLFFPSLLNAICIC